MMTQSLLIVLIGFVSGFCSSAPLGPINMWLVELALKKKLFLQHALPFLAGVIMVDVSLAMVALWGYDQFLHEALPSKFVGLAGAFFLVVIGAVMLYSHFLGRPFGKRSSLSARLLKNPRWQTSQSFLIGMLLCVSNPALLLFWAYIVKQMNHHISLVPSLTVNLSFALGVSLGDAFWFRSLIYLVTRGRSQLGGLVIDKIRFGIAFAFIMIGVLGFLQN